MFAKRGVTVLLLLAALVALDLILGTVLIPYFDPSPAIRNLDTYYNHGLDANSKGIVMFGHLQPVYYTNSLSFRDSKIRDIPDNDDKRRILFLGDSYTEGVGYAWDSTFCGLLQNSVNSSKVEILNAGVASYSPKLEYLKLEYLVKYKKLKVDDVYCFLDNSDISDELVYQDFEPHLSSSIDKITNAIGRFCKHHSVIYDTYSLIASRKFLSDNGLSKESIGLYWLANGNKFSTDTKRQFEYFRSNWIFMLDSPVTGKALKLTQNGVLNIKKLCDQNGFHFHLCIYPNTSYIALDQDEDGKIATDICKKYVGIWQKFSSQNNIDFVNLFPLFASEDHSAAIINRKLYYIPRDSHWNYEGHRKVADSLGIIINR